MRLGDYICMPERYILGILGFFTVVNAFTMRLSFIFAFTEMTVMHTMNKTIGFAICGTSYDTEPILFLGESEFKFDFSEELQGAILSSFYWGYVLSHIPGGIIADKFGGKWTLSLGILSTAILTILTPMLAKTWGSTGIIVTRALVGLGEGSCFPALTVLLAHWVPLKERSEVGAFVYGGALFGGFLGNAVSGIIMSHWGWEAVFYIWGAMSILWFFIFILLCYNDPASHPYLRNSERDYLRKELSHLERNHHLPPVPFKHILTSAPVLALVVAQSGHNFGFYTITIHLTKYMADVLQFPVKITGYYVALIFLVMWISSIVFGFVCDFVIARDYITLLNARKLWTITSLLGPGIFMVAASYANCNKVAVVLNFVIGMGFMGFWYSGMKLNSMDLSPNYAGTLMAFSNGIGATMGIITPILVAALAPNSTLQEWRLVFWITFEILTFSSLVVAIFASAEVQPWNEPGEPDKI